jgi:phosphotransferase system  glucose/maltose/N-acetylglucosamine-specific IIC component
MAKNTSRKLSAILGMTVAVIASVGIGGLFVSGGFLDVVILKWLPLLVHQIVGWVIIVGALLSAILGMSGK